MYTRKVQMKCDWKETRIDYLSVPIQDGCHFLTHVRMHWFLGNSEIFFQLYQRIWEGMTVWMVECSELDQRSYWRGAVVFWVDRQQDRKALFRQWAKPVVAWQGGMKASQAAPLAWAVGSMACYQQ
jgi:hypothetical protein